MSSVELTHVGTMVNSMEEEWLWYLTGAIDSTGSINVKIQQDTRLSLGYSITPFIHFTRPESTEPVLGMIDEYCEEMNSKVNYRDINTSIRAEITGVENIRNFLEPIAGGMIQQQERIEYFLDEVLPHFNDGPPQSKKEFIEVMKVVDELKKYPIVSGSSKYSTEYFREEWAMR